MYRIKLISTMVTCVASLVKSMTDPWKTPHNYRTPNKLVFSDVMIILNNGFPVAIKSFKKRRWQIVWKLSYLESLYLWYVLKCKKWTR